MPSLIPIRQYQADDAYNHVIDNQPIQDIERNLDLINAVVEQNSQAILDAIGTEGTIANRLAVSINDDGTLKTTAVDDALHSIEEHEDTDDYVRMTSTERDKLSGIASGATDFSLEVDGTSYDSGELSLQDSDSITWRNEIDGVYADVNFPLTSRHRHYYDKKPVHVDLITPDYQNYYTTSVPTAYVENSLRVYINGVRISKLDSDPSPPPDVSFPRLLAGEVSEWVEIYYEEDTGSESGGIITSGKFTLSVAIDEDDRIMVDFDEQLA